MYRVMADAKMKNDDADARAENEDAETTFKVAKDRKNWVCGGVVCCVVICCVVVWYCVSCRV